MSDDLPSDRRLLGGWRMVFPPGWVSIPTEPEQSRRAIGALLDRTFRGQHRDELIQVRVGMDRRVRELVADARDKGISHVHFLAEPIRGVPVSASLVVASVATPSDDELASEIAAVLGSDQGVREVTHTDIGGFQALRRVRRMDAASDVSGHTVTHTWVEYVCPVSDAELLLMSFETNTHQVANEMTQVFDMMAATLRHHEPDS